MRAHVLLALSVFLGIACSSERTQYASTPDSLKGHPYPKLPSEGPSGDGGGPVGACPGGNPTPPPECASVKFENVLTGILIPNCGGDGCHVKPSGSTLPILDPTDATASWQNLAKQITATKKYLDPCSLDPNASSIICNINFQGTAGSCGALMPYLRNPLPDTAKATIEQYVKCGAPKP